MSGRVEAAYARRAAIIAAAAAAALSVMLFCTRSSFLFPMNNWDDANSYFTMGKSMMHGILIYRDIFDDLKDYTILEPAYRAAREIPDEVARAEALLYLVQSIDKM